MTFSGHRRLKHAGLLPPLPSRQDPQAGARRPPLQVRGLDGAFAGIRWASTNGKPVCPHCGCLDAYDCRRPSGAPRWRCRAKECEKDFSLTSGTLFAFDKLPIATYLLAIAIFVNEVKGKSMLALSGDLGVDYKTAFVSAHKLREAMGEEMRGRVGGGEGKTAEVDAGWFGGYVGPAFSRSRRSNEEWLSPLALLASPPGRAAPRGRRQPTRLWPEPLGRWAAGPLGRWAA